MTRGSMTAMRGLARRADSRRGSPPGVGELLVERLAGRTFAFEVIAQQRGVLAGMRGLSERASDNGIAVERFAADGDRIEPGTAVCRARVDAGTVEWAEDILLSSLAKPSGVATAAAHLFSLADGRARVVCGPWKKVAPGVRAELRDAAGLGGAGMRILDRPFVYLDRNHVRMLGGIGAAVREARRIGERAVVAQLRGETACIADEADEAIAAGAELLMVDTGCLADLEAVVARATPVRDRIVVAFGSGVTAETLPRVVAAGAAVVVVGRAILDAPMLDFRLDVH